MHGQKQYEEERLRGEGDRVYYRRWPCPLCSQRIEVKTYLKPKDARKGTSILQLLFLGDSFPRVEYNQKREGGMVNKPKRHGTCDEWKRQRCWEAELDLSFRVEMREDEYLPRQRPAFPLCAFRPSDGKETEKLSALCSCRSVLISVPCPEPNDPLILAAFLLFTLGLVWWNSQLFSFKVSSSTVEMIILFAFSLANLNGRVLRTASEEWKGALRKCLWKRKHIQTHTPQIVTRTSWGWKNKVCLRDRVIAECSMAQMHLWQWEPAGWRRAPFHVH